MCFIFENSFTISNEVPSSGPTTQVVSTVGCQLAKCILNNAQRDLICIGPKFTKEGIGSRPIC